MNGGGRKCREISIHAPLAGCDHSACSRRRSRRYFNPRTPCGVRHVPAGCCATVAIISIHAPLAGCDPRGDPARDGRNPFQSTHPLRGATNPRYPHIAVALFQSTHPLRGATTMAVAASATRRNFNPRTPCGVRRGRGGFRFQPANFNPRTPCGVRRGTIRFSAGSNMISIHAPLAGCDSTCLRRVSTLSDFNPRTPCGVRPLDIK